MSRLIWMTAPTGRVSSAHPLQEYRRQKQESPGGEPILHAVDLGDGVIFTFYARHRTFRAHSERDSLHHGGYARAGPIGVGLQSVLVSPRVSVVVPMYNAAEYLPVCLGALRQSLDDAVECLIVDDGSKDDSAATAMSLGFRVLSTGGRSSSGAARNLGVREANGEILLFVDADVRVHPDTVQRVLRAFAEEPALGAISGSYDDAPSHPSRLSQWRNLLHCYTHQTANPKATTFWTGCGAIRRDVFADAGGFDERFRFLQDVELGVRLHRAGVELRLDPRIQVQHCKHWTLREMVRTDVVARAGVWTQIILRERNMPNDLNLKWGQRVSGVLALLSLPLLGAGVFQSELLGAGLLCLIGTAVLNRGFYRFLAVRRGWAFVALTLPLHFLYYCCAVLGFIRTVGRYLVAADRDHLPPVRSEM